jgi:gas vesicle protein
MNPTKTETSSEERGGNPRRTFLIWFAIGAAAGATAGLLLAPCSGEQTRTAIGAKVGYTAESSRIYLESAKGYVARFVDTARRQAERFSISVAAGVEEAQRIKQELVEFQEPTT